VGDDAAGLSAGEPTPRIGRVADGRIAVRLAPREREVLGALAAELAREAAGDVLPEAGGDDPGLARLSPDAVADDAAASAAFRELAGDDLASARQQRLAMVAETIDAVYLDEAHAQAWLGAVNDLRLVHGTRLGVTEETGSQPVDESDPNAGRLIVFLWLGWLEEQLVEALAAGLPESEEDR
jgi:Domain of unknown function (DUF2017)